MKYYFVVGERSGDLHASNLIRSLRTFDPATHMRGMGGELMKEQGADIFKDYNEVAYMGFFEVFKNLFKIMAVLKEVKKDILDFKPHVIVLVDFAGFNLKIAAFAKVNNIKVFYYISPKIWAWNQKRAFKIKHLIDKMFVILPFEQKFYEKYLYKVEYVGNPVYDSVRNFRPKENFEMEHGITKPVIALLPGSRRQEVINMLTVMKDLPPLFKEYQFVIAAVSNIPLALYKEYLEDCDLKIIIDNTYDLLVVAKAAVVTSGTATLETALFEVPQVVVYKTSWISYRLAKALIKIKFISLVNLIADKAIVKELIQGDFTAGNIRNELEELLKNKQRKEKLLISYRKIKSQLGEEMASEKTARLMHYYLQQ